MYLEGENKPLITFKNQLAYIWVMVLLAIIFYAIAWYAFGGVGLMVIAALEDSMTLASPFDTISDFVKNVIYLHPVISLLGWLLWGFYNSIRRDTTFYER